MGHFEENTSSGCDVRIQYKGNYYCNSWYFNKIGGKICGKEIEK